MTQPRVVVLVTAGCHLCADACAVVGSVCEQRSVAWEARDLVELDDETRARWREYVPVVLIDGQVHDVLRVDRTRLEAAL